MEIIFRDVVKILIMMMSFVIRQIRFYICKESNAIENNDSSFVTYININLVKINMCPIKRMSKEVISYMEIDTHDIKITE